MGRRGGRRIGRLAAPFDAALLAPRFDTRVRGSLSKHAVGHECVVAGVPYPCSAIKVDAQHVVTSLFGEAVAPGISAGAELGIFFDRGRINLAELGFKILIC